MIDLKLVCRKIYNAAYVAAGKAYSGAPLAYIHIKTGINCAVDTAALSRTFDELKWDSPLATADLSITADPKIEDNLLKIESVEEFMDDNGIAEEYSVHPDDKIIQLED